MTRRATITVVIGSLVLMAVACVALVGMQLERWRRPTMAKWSRVALGMSEDEVRQMLGPPRAAYTTDTAPRDYYVNGYAYKTRDISGSVLIYMERDLIFYAWFDGNGRLEATFIGSS